MPIGFVALQTGFCGRQTGFREMQVSFGGMQIGSYVSAIGSATLASRGAGKISRFGEPSLGTPEKRRSVRTLTRRRGLTDSQHRSRERVPFVLFATPDVTLRQTAAKNSLRGAFHCDDGVPPTARCARHLPTHRAFVVIDSLSGASGRLAANV